MAGDRVITDLLAKPFSMGKNLCVLTLKAYGLIYVNILPLSLTFHVE